MNTPLKFIGINGDESDVRFEEEEDEEEEEEEVIIGDKLIRLEGG